LDEVCDDELSWLVEVIEDVLIALVNSAPFLFYLHHHHCQSQDIIFIPLLYPSPPCIPLKTKMSSLQKPLPWFI